MIAKDLSERHKFNADPKAIQQINFTANLDRNRNRTTIEEAKETRFRFVTRQC